MKRIKAWLQSGSEGAKRSNPDIDVCAQVILRFGNGRRLWEAVDKLYGGFSLNLDRLLQKLNLIGPV